MEQKDTTVQYRNLTLPHWPKELDAHAAEELEISAVSLTGDVHEIYSEIAEENKRLKATLDKIREVAYTDDRDHYEKLEYILTFL